MGILRIIDREIAILERIVHSQLKAKKSLKSELILAIVKYLAIKDNLH